MLYLRLIWVGVILSLLSSLCYSGADKAIVGYFPFWAYYRDGQTLADVNIRPLTHLIYASAILNDTGEVVPADQYTDLTNVIIFDSGERVEGNYRAVDILKKQKPDLAILLTIGGWGQSQNYSTVLRDKNKRDLFIATAVQLKNQYGFDGFEFDWRYPITGGYEKNSKSPDDLKNLEIFFQELKLECPDCHISVTLSEQAHNRHGWDYPLLSQYIDYYHILTATFHGAWSLRTGHRSPLYVDPAHPLPAIATVVDEVVEQGLKPEKIILRVAAVAAGWENVGSNRGGLFQSFDGVSLGTWDEENSGRTGLIAHKELSKLLKNPDYEQHWDEAVKASTLYNPKTKQFISYESKESLHHKLTFIQDKDLGGVAVWEVASDVDGADGLIAVTFGYFRSFDAFLYRVQKFIVLIAPWMTMALVIWALTTLLYKWSAIRKKNNKELDTHKRVRYALRALPQHLDQIIYLSISPPPSLAEKLSAEQLKALNLLAEKSVIARNSFSPLTRIPQIGRTSFEQQATESVTVEAFKENLSDSTIAKADEALLSLERFTHLISETNNLEKMMETMFTFLSGDFRVKGVSLWNEEELMGQSGEMDEHPDYDGQGEVLNVSDDRVKAMISNPEMGGYQISLEFQSPLSPSEEAYFRGLGNQVIFARQQFRELAKQPQLLLELYEIARRKDKLLFIKGEKGYSGIHSEDLKEPIFVFSRLRALRMYFPELLVQVHRSYLINPACVEGVVKKDTSYQLKMRGHFVPIARSFLSRLRAEYPHWFSV